MLMVLVVCLSIVWSFNFICSQTVCADSYKVCPKCGSKNIKQLGTDSISELDSMLCSNCKYIFRSTDAKYVSSSSTSSDKSSSSSSNVILVIAVGIGALLFIVAMANKKKNVDNNKNNS